MEIQKALDELKALKIDYNLDLGIDFDKAQSEINQALQLQQTGVNGSALHDKIVKQIPDKYKEQISKTIRKHYR